MKARLNAKLCKINADFDAKLYKICDNFSENYVKFTPIPCKIMYDLRQIKFKNILNQRKN